jgi:hypothetical protein
MDNLLVLGLKLKLVDSKVGSFFLDCWFFKLMILQYMRLVDFSLKMGPILNLYFG